MAKYKTNRTGRLSLGVHTLRISDVKEQDSAKGDPMAVWSFECVDEGPEYGASPQPLFTVLEGPKRWKWDQLLDALQIPEGQEIELTSLIDGIIEAEIIADEWEGRVRSVVDTMMVASTTVVQKAKERVAAEPPTAALEEDFDIPF